VSARRLIVRTTRQRSRLFRFYKSRSLPERSPMLFGPRIGMLEKRHNILLEPVEIVDNRCWCCFHLGTLIISILSGRPRRVNVREVLIAASEAGEARKPWCCCHAHRKRRGSTPNCYSRNLSCPTHPTRKTTSQPRCTALWRACAVATRTAFALTSQSPLAN